MFSHITIGFDAVAIDTPPVTETELPDVATWDVDTEFAARATATSTAPATSDVAAVEPITKIG
jgi:hypothetical protein